LLNAKPEWPQSVGTISRWSSPSAGFQFPIIRSRNVSHITIIINREPPSDQDTDAVVANVEYVVPDDETDEDVGRKVRKMVKQVRELGT
jgi:hypothetical protein